MSESKKHIVEGAQGWDEELRGWLEDYIVKHPHHPTTVLSRSQYIGVARRALDAYLAGTYFLPKEADGQGFNPESSKIEHAVRAYRERVEGTIRHGYSRSFVETRTWFQLQRACAKAINENVIVVIYGKPGVGKTRCLVEFAVQKMITAPISILCSRNITTHYFAQKLARALNLNDRPLTARLEDAVAEKLKRYPRPLFIDQANYLNERSLGTICYIWEVARIPIVLVGTKDLYDLFITSRLTEDVRAQLSSRVALHYLLPELIIAEVKAIIQRNLGEDANDEVVAQIFNVTGGIYRHVDMILPHILQLKARHHEKLATGKMAISEVISSAGSRLMTG